MGVLPEVEENENERKAFKSEFVAQTHHLKNAWTGKLRDSALSFPITDYSLSSYLFFCYFLFLVITVTIRHLFYARHHTSSSRLHR